MHYFVGQSIKKVKYKYDDELNQSYKPNLLG